MTSTPTPSLADTTDSSLGQILQYVDALTGTMSTAVKQIKEVNSRTLLLSLNAKIEAQRAGAAGAAFGVVASEMQQLADRTNKAADAMEHRATDTINDLRQRIGSSIRGGRLSDLALTNIDLVDRNLYERTCDVRWWATDSSLVDALESPSEERFRYASERLGVILDAYTVYLDLVLCDSNGVIVANGRPSKYRSQGQSVSARHWFREAMRSFDGGQYGFESAERSSLVEGASVLTYSCGVREGGAANGRLLGVLGILFDWESFAQTIVNQTPLSAAERAATRCMLCDDQGRLLADSWGRQLDETLSMAPLAEVTRQQKGFLVRESGGRSECIAHAKSPGFETYRTGWHSIIIQAD